MMAENEILDIGNSWHYRKWRHALNNPILSLEQKADLLGDELIKVTQKRLLGEPLFRILQACNHSPAALRAAIASCKHRDLAVLVEQAISQVRSQNTIALGAWITDRTIDRIIDQVRYYALANASNRDQAWHDDLARTSIAKLEGCRAELTILISASLSDAKLPRLKRKPNKTDAAGDLAGKSLLRRSQQQPPSEPHHA